MKETDIVTAVRDVISTEMDGEAVLMHVPKGKYFTLNETGSLVWKQLEEGEASLINLMQVIMEDFDVEEEVCRIDIEAMLKGMMKAGVVKKAS